MHNRLGAGEVQHVAEARLETQQFVIDGEAPAIDPVHRMHVASDGLDVERLLMLGNAQLVTAAELREILAQGFRLAQQAVGKGGNEHGGIVVEREQSFQISGIDGVHPVIEDLSGLFHVFRFPDVIGHSLPPR